MNKTIHFIAGLPRTGSTLLCNILNQNPMFRASATSPLIEMVVPIKNQWNNIATNLAEKPSQNMKRKMGVLRGMMDGFYEPETAPVVFDKSRGWGHPHHIQFLKEALPYPVKVIVTVRDAVDILTSLEMEYRRAVATGAPPNFPKDVPSETIEQRARWWAGTTGIAGSPAANLKAALEWGHGDAMLFVEYESLVNKPEETMKQIYTWLGYDYFHHDFGNVEQTTFEDDRLHGYSDKIHAIKKVVSPPQHNPAEVLGSVVVDAEVPDGKGRMVNLRRVVPLSSIIKPDNFWRNAPNRVVHTEEHNE